ncbi:hypothetical protein COU54_03755 [Candidatus Pacearchaeota archaeon CG10_big_fil_rev_8_21_14_0_10_31_24]|nr:MAG: hypothetical protein COU54_03755 [Candidatus Pacearchaeota archaeon CG10_big_fil_rev_8_21_14_0_10_31_24]
MGQRERIILNKIYIGRAALFGLYYGIIMGLLVVGFLLISFFILGSMFENSNFKFIDLSGWSSSNSTSGEGGLKSSGSPINGNATNSGGSSGLASFIVVEIVFFIFHVLASVIAMMIFAMVYNLTSKLGGSIHFDLEEYGISR